MDQVGEFFSRLFSSSDWPPRWHCGEWTSFHGWLYIISDLLIWSAYFTIPIVIIRYLSKKKDIRFVKLYFLFAAFILACGATHLLDAIAFWIPAYRLSALFRFVTGIISWVTVFYLIKNLPQIFSLKPQKALEAEIEQRIISEEKFRGLLEAAPDAMVIANEKGLIILVNRQTEKLFGYTKDELISKPVEILIPTSLHHKHVAHREKYTQDPHVRSMGAGLELEALKKDGSKFPVEISLSPLVTKDGTLISASVRDITERIKAEKKIKEFQYFFNHSNDLSCIANNEGFFEIVNPSFTKILGYSENELYNHSFIDFVHPDDIAASLEIYGQLKSGATVLHFTNRYRKKDNSYLWLEWNATPNPITGKLYCIARDITDRKKAEDALSKLNEELEQRVEERTIEIEKNEKRFRALIENSHDIITLMNDQFNVIYRSPSASRTNGWSHEELKDVSILKNIHPADIEIAKEIMQELIKNPGKELHVSFRIQHKDKHYLWVEGTVINLLHDADVKAIVFNFRDITQRKKLETLLHKANTLARMGSWEVDLVNETVYWSDITREIHETEYKYVPDLSTAIIFYKEGPGRDLITQKVKEAIESGKPWDEELQIITAKNNEKWIRTIGETEFINGKCVRIYGSFQDIHQRKEAEEKIIASEKRFRTTLDNMLEGAQIIGFDWRYIYINDSFEKHARYRRDEMIGYTVMEKFPGIEQTEVYKVYERCFAERVSIHLENEFKFPDGTIGWFELSFQPIPEGIFILSIDITERKKAEANIIRAETNYREIFDKASDAIYVHEIDTGRIIEVNQKAVAITGFSKEEILNSNPEIFTSDNPEYTVTHAVTYLQKAAAGEPQLFDWLTRKKDGSDSWMEVNLKKATIAGEERILAFFREINDRKKAQLEVQKLNEELEQKVISRTEQLKRTNEELEAFSYSVSHDLRAPLRGIIGFTNILEEDYSSKLDDEAMRITSVIKTNTMRMANLIDDLLAFSRMGRQELLKAPVDTNTMVREIIDELKPTNKNPQLQWHIEPLPEIDADIATMRQVWTNLISNAIKYSSTSQKPQITIGHYTEKQQQIFFVKDNGVGFNNEYRNKLFRVFQRLHNSQDFEGTGIGLAIVEKVITKHGGKVWAEAEVNKGACFFFSLPVTNEKNEK